MPFLITDNKSFHQTINCLHVIPGVASAYRSVSSINLQYVACVVVLCCVL